MTKKRDFYDVLGLTKDASEADIKSAYRKLAIKYHPDKNSGEKASEEKFKEVTEAYEILSDQQKRAQYDHYGHDAFKYQGAGAGGFGNMEHAEEIFRAFFGEGGTGIFGDIFDGIFGGTSTGTRARRANRGSDLQMSIEIDFKEAAFGVEKEIKVPRFETCHTCKGEGTKPGTSKVSCSQCNGRGQVRSQTGFLNIARACPRCQGEGEIIETPCPECRGQGRVKAQRKLKVNIPAGIDNNSRIRISGEGEAGTRGGACGDLYVVIYVKDHPIFKREGNHIICDVPITFVQASIGDEIEVPTLEDNMKIKIPAGTQSGKVLSFKGRGIKDLHSHGRGDEFIRIIVETPTKLSSKQKQLLKEFAASGNSFSPTANSFMDKIRKICRHTNTDV